MADRDPAIKIFGRSIPLPDSDSGVALDLDPVNCSVDGEEKIHRGITNMEAKDPKPRVTEEKDQGEPAVSSVLNNSHEDVNQTCTQVDKGTTESKPEQDQSEADTTGQDKVLKKPDKLLPCPRCNSMDTKFCYYNNYNVNQPRHFCKNCQRYWTAGGMMRNVPVGAGRRKSKHCGYLETLPVGLPTPIRPLNENGAVLKFGPEAPISETMSFVLNHEEQKMNAKIAAMASEENGEEPSCASSVTASNRVEKDLIEKEIPKEQNIFHGAYNGPTLMHPMQYFPGPPWPYWGPGWNDAAAMAANPLLWAPPAMLPAPVFCAPPVPFPFMPSSYWPCMPSWPNGAWNAPWLGTNSSGIDSGNGSPTLGKHSRDDSSQEEEKSERSLWVPKTLRIHDPDEAAKSSIWSTLGIKPDESMKRRDLFEAFQPDNESSDNTSAPAQILHANPAALSRSWVFQEST